MRPANLESDQLSQLQQLEQDFRHSTGENIIIVAYQQDAENESSSSRTINGN